MPNWIRQRKALRRISLPVLMALALLLTACGGGTATPTASALPTAAVPVATAAMPEPVAGGTLRVAMQPLVQTDPALISSDSEVLVANHVYDYLVDINSRSEIVPRLAKEWRASDDGLSYTFTLVDNATWHDGDPLTPQDIIWTFKRLQDPAIGSSTADLYANIQSIEATGEHEVTFKLNQPNPFFLYDLSDNHALVIKDGVTDATDFNGTGPFKLTSYSPEDRIILAANPNYFVAGEPSLSELQIIFFNDETAAVDALISGQIDLAMRMSTALFQSLKDRPGLVAIDIPTNGFDLVRLRADREPGNKPEVIQALKLATDRQAIWELVLQGYGAVGRDSPVGPSYSAFYSEDTAIPARNVDEARRLLAAAGYPDGLNLTLHTPDTGNRPDLAAVLQSQWAEAGIIVDISVEPESVYYGDNGWLDVDLGITGWGSRPYPQFYLDVMLKTGAKWNEAHWSDAEFDQLATLAGTTLNEAERVQAYQDIQRILIERGPVIIPYFFAQYAAINEKFATGFDLKAFAGRTDFRTVVFTP